MDPETGRSWLPQRLQEFDMVLTTHHRVRTQFWAHESYLSGIRRTVTVPVGESQTEADVPTYGWSGAGQATRVLVAEQGGERPSAGVCPLYNMRFARVVLDEGHRI